MIPWRQIGSAAVPEEDHPLLLLERGGEYAIQLGSLMLMSSLVHGSEELLAELACARLGDRPGARVLIGGLGMGFTLAAALRTLGPQAQVEVAELVPAVVEWNRGPLAHLAGNPLADPRVVVRVADVAVRIGAVREGLDAILLDVDNGPDGLTRGGNDGLYAAAGLRAAFAALRGGGILGVWSAAPDPAFSRRLRQVGFVVAEQAVKAGRTRGGRHVVWLATRPRGGGISGHD